MSGRLWRWATAAVVAGMVMLIAAWLVLPSVRQDVILQRAGYFAGMTTLYMVIFGAVWFALRARGGETFGKESSGQHRISGIRLEGGTWSPIDRPGPPGKSA